MAAMLGHSWRRADRRKESVQAAEIRERKVSIGSYTLMPACASLLAMPTCMWVLQSCSQAWGLD